MAPAESHGYTPVPTKTDFRDVQHNPELLQQLKNLNWINESISTVHVNHIGVKTFEHAMKFSVETAKIGLDQACLLLNVFSAECKKDKKSCQLVGESMNVNKRAGNKFIHILNAME